MIADIGHRAVLHAVAEAARMGPDKFLRRHGFQLGTRDTVEVGGLELPPKAVLGVAARYQYGEPLRASEFSGGLRGAARVLVNLGFRVWRDGELLTDADVAIPRRLALRPLEGELRLYVCRPTGARVIEACRQHNFGSLLAPLTARKLKGASGHKLDDLSGHTRPLEGLPYALDNGVWPCHVSGETWSEKPFMKLLDRLGEHSAFCVLPDIVGGGEDSLRFSLDWWRDHQRGIAGDVPTWLLAVQDGMTVDRVRKVVADHGFGGLFVGGSRDWKWRTVVDWAELGLELGLRVHVGRVNGERKAALCRDLGVTSIDGSCVSRYAVNATKMGRSCDGTETPPARRQLHLDLGAST